MNSLFSGIEFKVQSPQFEKTTKDGKRIIRGYASTDALDRQNEIISREALEGAKKDLLDNTTVFMEHQHSMLPIGKVTDCILDDNGLLIEVSLSNAKFVDDIWTLMEEGILSSFSIGGVVLDGHDERDDDGKSYHIIDKISILEVSVVGLPANPEAKFEPVYKSFNSAIVEQLKKKEGSINMVEKDKQEVTKSEEVKEEVKKDEVVSEEVKEVKKEVEELDEKKEEKEEVVEKVEEKETVVEEVKEEKVEEDKVVEKEEVVEEKVEEVKEEVKVDDKVEEVVKEDVAEASEEAENVVVEEKVSDEVVEKTKETSLAEKAEEEIEAEKVEEEVETEKSTEEKILDALALIIEKLSSMSKVEVEEKKEEVEAEKSDEVKEEKDVEEVSVDKKEEEVEEEEAPSRKSIAVVVPSPYDEVEKAEVDPKEVEKKKNTDWNKLIFG